MFGEAAECKAVTVTEPAYAKINLFLDVTVRREDGFHEICSYMHTVSLCDIVTVTAKRASAPSVVLKIVGNDALPTDERNTAYRVALEYMREFVPMEIFIQLEKKIPAEAGLAGGSSDAAAVLRALNRITDGALSTETLLGICEKIGSDVPYCFIGGTCLCTGRGETLTPIAASPRLHLVIAKGKQGASTPKMYAELDRRYNGFANYKNERAETALADMKNALEGENANEIAKGLYNIFEDCVLDMCPEATVIRQAMLDNGALGAMVSGSGPGVFGIFESEERARCVASLLGDCAHYAESV